MKVIFSIKPEFAEKILNGTKRFEFRRSIFKRQDVKTVVIYATAPVGKLMGEFEIRKVHFGRIEDLWKLSEPHGGVEYEFFKRYFAGRKTGYAIEVAKYRRYPSGKSLQKVFGISPPQSFAYAE